MSTETADKTIITNFITTLPKTGVSALSPVTFYFGLDPPAVCSDGVRRPNILDYIDFLFQSPTIDQVIKTYLGTTAYSITLVPGTTLRQFNAIVKNTGVLPTLLVRSTASSGSTLPVTLTLCTQTTTASGTTFTNASSASSLTVQKWDSGFSSALPLPTGYITATPGAFFDTGAYTILQFGLSTSALVVPNTVGVATSFTVTYGFYILRGPASNGIPGSVSLYKIMPGATLSNPIQLGLASYTTPPVLTVSYDGQFIRYYINGVLATNYTGGGASAIAVSLNTLYAAGLLSFSGDSFTGVTWGTVVPGPKGVDGANGSQGIQGSAGPAGPQGAGFTTIAGTTTTGNLLIANGTTNSAYAQSGLAYGGGVLASSAMTATGGAMTAAISSTVSGLIPSGFLSYSKTGFALKSGATNTVLSGLSASGLYFCSAIGNTGSGTGITQLSQFYIVKIPTTGYSATQIVASPTTLSTTIRWAVVVGASSFSITLYNSGGSDQTVNLGITLLANTVNFS